MNSMRHEQRLDELFGRLLGMKADLCESIVASRERQFSQAEILPRRFAPLPD
jgi:hypothetical protein